MAKCEIKLLDELLLKLSKLAERADEVTDKMLEAGGAVALEETKKSLRAVVGVGTKTKSRSTGELERALGLSGIKVGRNGNRNIKIGFSEPRSVQSKSKKKRSSYVTTNAMIATILEYGKHGQPAKPFLASAKKASLSKVRKEMQRVFEEETK